MSQNPFDSYLESQVYSASPVRLVTILYRAALDSLEAARQHLVSGDIRKRAEASARASNVVAELTQSLNLDTGGEIARNLLHLYDYLLFRIHQANMNSDERAYAECIQLLATLLDGWQSIGEPAGEAQGAYAGAEQEYQPIEFSA
ncbi:MAG: flagellar export chaperone FliS [Bryobacterales bacterium]|nr:flagellar export chaperone FliS [Bryobacterales bacterium]